MEKRVVWSSRANTASDEVVHSASMQC